MEDISAPLVNRVANSGLITINLEDHYPTHEIVNIDLKQYLFMELILKEKDFRQALKDTDWTIYQDKIITISCSVDAIIPLWAYMLITSHATPYAHELYVGSNTDYLSLHYTRTIGDLDISTYQDQRIVIKGCSNKQVPTSAYAQLTARLQPVVKKIMFGEPCSTVPIYNRK